MTMVLQPERVKAPRPHGDETHDTIVAYVVARPPGPVTPVCASEGPGVERTLALKGRVLRRSDLHGRFLHALIGVRLHAIANERTE